MKRLALLFALLIAVSGAAQIGPDQDPQTSISTANQDWSDAMRRGDAVALAGAYADNALYCGADGQCAAGRAAIEQQFRARFSTLGRARTANVNTTSVVRDRDLAYEWGVADVRFAGGSVLRARYLTVWQRQPGGGWQIYRNLVLPAQGFGPSGPSRDPASAQDSYALRCDSDDGRRHTCTARGQIGRVELSRQVSGSACVPNQTWGWAANSLWVDRGCRAEFTVYPYAQQTQPAAVEEYNDSAKILSLKCESEDMNYRFCPAGATVRQVRLVRQISGSPCEETRTWGWKSDGVWVNKGCRAEFEVTKR